MFKEFGVCVPLYSDIECVWLVIDLQKDDKLKSVRVCLEYVYGVVMSSEKFGKDHSFTSENNQCNGNSAVSLVPNFVIS